MIVLPSLDISDGRVVGRRHGPKSEWPVYGDDPAAVARRWADEGAEALHVADMDEAIEGFPAALPVLRKVAEAVAIPVEFSSPVATLAAAEAALDAGARWAVFRQEMLAKETALAEAVERLGDGLTVAFAAGEDGEASAARALEAAGVGRLIVRDATADGALSGPNVAMLRGVVEAVSVPILAAGGVASVEDVRAVREAGVVGVIVGRALYDGVMTLKEAIAAAR